MTTRLSSPVIDRTALEVSDPADLLVEHRVIAGTDALVVDNVYRHPEYVRQLALDLSFHRTAGGYPGYLAFITISAAPVLALLNRLMGARIGSPLAFTPTYQDDMVFAVVTSRGDELTVGQRRPHVDGFCDYAALVYLNPPDQCAGGTSFWRHRRSGIEVAAGGPGANAALAKLAAASRTGPEHDPQSTASDGYLIESNAHWERTEVLQMRFNRLVLYSSYLYHSPLYDDRDFGLSLDERRLTQNLYLSRDAR